MLESLICSIPLWINLYCMYMVCSIIQDISYTMAIVVVPYSYGHTILGIDCSFIHLMHDCMYIPNSSEKPRTWCRHGYRILNHAYIRWSRINFSDRNKNQKLVSRFLKIGLFVGYWLTSHWKYTVSLADQNGFGQPYVEIGQKMADGQLLFLALNLHQTMMLY